MRLANGLKIRVSAVQVRPCPFKNADSALPCSPVGRNWAGLAYGSRSLTQRFSGGETGRPVLIRLAG